MAKAEVIQVAIVQHKHGVNVYLSRTKDGLNPQVAEFCRDWWADAHLDGDAPDNDADCIDRYSAALEGCGEWVDFTEAGLEE